MRYAYFGFGMLLFGSIGLVIIVMMQSIAINNDSEYYNLKEAMEASMIESVDYVCYRVEGKEVTPDEDNECGYNLKMSEQKFVENFTRRFVATIGGDAKGYTLEFYDIIESPPKASVVVKGHTNNYGVVSQNESFTITNSLSGILQLKRGIGNKYSYYNPTEIDSVSVEPISRNDANSVIVENELSGHENVSNDTGKQVSTCVGDVCAEVVSTVEDDGSDEDEILDGEQEEDSDTCTSSDDYDCDEE